ncbi:MAG: AsmA-like C-terminal region-containing protein, partial [Parafilimonas sp.]
IGFLQSKLKKTILGKLKIDKAEITVWQTFPKIGITLKNVTISDSFYNKPFLRAGEITAKAGFLDLMGSKLTISSIRIKDAVIHSFTDARGYSNTYVLRSHSDSSKAKDKSKKPVVFRNLELKNVSVIIEDAIKNKRYAARIDNADIDMRLTGSKYYITFDEDLFLRGLGFKFVQGYWLENQRIQAKWRFVFDTTGNILSFKDTKVKIQGQPFIIKGEFDFGKKSEFHIDAVTKAISYSTALGILKPKIREKLQKLNLKNVLDVNASLTGSLSHQGDPSVKVDFKTQNNAINTPVINLNNCNFSGNFINQADTNIPPDDSNSIVTIKSFTSSWGDINVKAPNITVSNFTKPTLQFEFFSECTLPQLDDQLSSETLNFVSGNAKLYLAYNGPLITDPSLLNQLNAKIQIENGNIVYVPRSLTFSECNGAISITGNNLLMNNFQCNLNTNHFVVNVTGNNLNRISTKEAGKATINCNVFSPDIDLTDFKALFAKKAKLAAKKSNNNLRSTANAIDNAVENGDLFLNVKAQKLSLHHFTASNVIANVFFKNDDWEIKQASMLHADGSFNLTAKVHQVNDNLHQLSAHVNLQNINVKKLFYGFDNFGQATITANNLKGIMNAKADISAGISNAGKFITNTMNGELIFSLKNAALINLKSFQNIQQYVFKDRNLSNVEFAELKNTFDIKNGDIYIPRMIVQSSALTMYIEGVYSFADRTDISIQVPLSTLKNKPEDYKTIDKAKAEKPGASIYLRAKDKNGEVKIGLDLFKKFRRDKHKKDAE